MPPKKRHKTKHQDFVVFEHPFSQVPQDILIKGLIETAKSSREEFPLQLTAIVNLIRSVNPLQVIATLSAYGMTMSVTDGGRMRPLHKNRKFNQSHIELLQAISLQVRIDELNSTPPTSETIQNLFDTLPDLGDSFRLQRMAVLEQERSEEQKSVGLLQEHLRLHTQGVRNWGYFKRVVGLTRRLCDTTGPLFQKHLGITASDLVNVFEFLLERLERLMTARMHELREIFSQTTPGKIIRNYYALNPNFKDTAAELLEFTKSKNLSLEQIKSLILSHSELTLANAPTFSSHELSRHLNLPTDSISLALDKLSLSFGDLANLKATSFFLDNPVWRKPIIKLSDTSYFCAMPQVFFSFIFQILETLLDGDELARSSYHARKAEFLESEIAELFGRAFPGCTLVQNYKWLNDEKEYENDLLVRVDSHLLLVEAKSGLISWPALRGAPERAKRHVEELLFAPSDQSLRLATQIAEVIKTPALRDTLLPNFPIPLTPITTILRLSVTLEDFAVLQSNLHLVKQAGWVAEDHPLSTSILLADLEIVFDVLEPTAQKIHYLQRRTELEANMIHLGDEMDLLGFYLASGFNIGNAEFDGAKLQLTGMSRAIDQYYSALDNDIQKTKPRLKLSQWWADICNKLEEVQFATWSEVANILLSFSFPEQQQAEKAFKRIKKHVFKNWRNNNHLCSITIIPNMHRSNALGLFAFRDREREHRYKRMRNIAGQIFQNAHVQRCVILGVNIDEAHYPYSTLAIFYRDEKNLTKEEVLVPSG
jgi:hypothetical protein